MTRCGRRVLLLALLLLTTALMVPLKALYYPGLLFLLLIAGSGILVEINGRSVYRMFFAGTRRLARGEMLQVEYMLTNRSILPIFSMTVRIAFKKEIGIVETGQDEERFFVSPFKIMTFKRGSVCRRRGFYKVGDMSVTVRDPLGFFEKNLTFEKAVEIAVVPRVCRVAESSLILLDQDGRFRARNRNVEDRTAVRNLRAYEDKDPLQDVHWKVSARLGALYVKQFQVSARESLVIIVNGVEADYQIFKNRAGTLSETAVELGVSLCAHFLKRGWTVSMLFHGHGDPRLTLSDPGGMTAVLETAAAYEAQNETDLEKVLDAEAMKWTAGARFLLITPDAQGMYQEWGKRWRDRGLPVEVIDPSKEASYSYFPDFLEISC